MFCSQLLWIFKYLQRIALLNDRTFIHEDRMVGHIPGKCHFMGHDDHGRFLFCKLLDNLEDFSCKLGIQIRSRLLK